MPLKQAYRAPWEFSGATKTKLTARMLVWSLCFVNVGYSVEMLSVREAAWELIRQQWEGGTVEVALSRGQGTGKTPRDDRTLCATLSGWHSSRKLGKSHSSLSLCFVSDSWWSSCNLILCTDLCTDLFLVLFIAEIEPVRNYVFCPVGGKLASSELRIKSRYICPQSRVSLIWFVMLLPRRAEAAEL